MPESALQNAAFNAALSDNRVAINDPEAGLAAKLTMETSLLAGGITQGLGEKAEQLARHPFLTAFTVAATSGITWGIGYAATRLIPEFAPAAKFVLAGAALYAGVPQLKNSMVAAADTWHNPWNYRQNQSVIAANLGHSLFDIALYSAAGAGGFLSGKARGKLAAEIASSLELQATRKATTSHIPLLIEEEKFGPSIKQISVGRDPHLAEIYKRTAPAIFPIYHTPPGSAGSMATAFLVDDDLVATNNHALHWHSPAQIKLKNGELVDAELVARDKAADLALLKIKKGVTAAQPLELGTTIGGISGRRLYMIGHPRNISVPVASVGRMEGAYGMKFRSAGSGVLNTEPYGERSFEWISVGKKHNPALTEISADKIPERVIRREVLSHNVPGEPGNSGSPLVDDTGKVIGIQSTSGAYSWGTSVEHLKALIEVYRAEQSPGTWLNVTTHARPLVHPLQSEKIAYRPSATAAVDVLKFKKFGPRT